MRTFYLFCFLALCVLMLATLVPGAASSSNVEMAVEEVQPAATGEPDRDRPYRSYPAPTGRPAFRRYYQKRCYPGCHYGSAVVAPAAAADMDVEATATPARVRPYRSYPEPTGQAGFRRYYQKRCFPGCHYDGDVVTPMPTKIHP
jgi:hypothetical protein